MSRHRATVRPRWGRLALVAASTAVTLTSVLGGVGLLGTADPARAGGSPTAVSVTASAAPAATAVPLSRSLVRPAGRSVRVADAVRVRRAWEPADPTLPAASGAGRRVVFSESRQQVWLVGSKGRVRRTYLVSGSTYDNLEPGTYAVWSRSEDAVGIDDSGTMRFFVRFTRGDNGAAIGFHDIPVDDGGRVQRVAELGSPRSHGCIRQRTRDAVAMWEFAALGTPVVVTA